VLDAEGKEMDIMSYDDLLRRLDNVIASLRRRIDDEIDI